MQKSNSNINRKNQGNSIKNRSGSFNTNNSVSTITLRNGTEKRIRNKQTYRELYLEKMNFIPIEMPKNKGRNFSKKSSFAESDEFQILYSNKYTTLEPSLNSQKLKNDLLENNYKLNYKDYNKYSEHMKKYLDEKKINKSNFEKEKNISLIKNNNDTYNFIDDKKDEENIKHLQNTLEDVFSKGKKERKPLNCYDENNETLRRERKRNNLTNLVNKDNNEDKNNIFTKNKVKDNEINNSNIKQKIIMKIKKTII